MVVTLVQLLRPSRAVNDLNKGLEPLTVHALRLVKFTQFAENTQMTSPEMVIISWNDAGAIIEDTSISSTDQIFLEKCEKRRQFHKLPIGVFNEVNALIGFSANRSLGVTVDVNDS
nr:10111_t:CDS:2 [Entrophospora candida]